MEYNMKSMKAEEFINDAEILETIQYAEENKNNITLVDEIAIFATFPVSK